MTYEESLRLLRIRKLVKGRDGAFIKSIEIDSGRRLDMRIGLVSDDGAYDFQWCITQSSKDMLKMSLHMMDVDSKEGIFRVDYNSGHLNPKERRPELPDAFVPYIGKQFAINEHHVHYYVEGYRSLAWALPLAVTNIEQRELREDHYADDIASAVESFAKAVNIDIKFTILQSIL